MTDRVSSELKLAREIRLQCETVMAWRAAIVPGYGTRKRHAELRAEIETLLDQYNLLVLGR